MSAVTQLVERARAMKTQLANYRAKQKFTSQQVLGAGVQLAGGAAGGFLDGRLGEGETHELWGVPTALGAGLLVAVAGFAEVLPGSALVANFGLGAASYGLGNLVRDKSAPGED
jgi:hypothetical protein